jgi:ribonuclease HI
LLNDRARHDGHTGFEKIAAHKGNHGNEKADALAKAGSQQPRQPEMCEGDFQMLDEDARNP